MFLNLVNSKDKFAMAHCVNPREKGLRVCSPAFLCEKANKGHSDHGKHKLWVTVGRQSSKLSIPLTRCDHKSGF